MLHNEEEEERECCCGSKGRSGALQDQRGVKCPVFEEEGGGPRHSNIIIVFYLIDGHAYIN